MTTITTMIGKKKVHDIKMFLGVTIGLIIGSYAVLLVFHFALKPLFDKILGF